MAPHPLDQVLRHNTWATTTLLDFCAKLGPERLDAAASGTYGTLYGTLQHLVGGEQWYLMLLTGSVLGGPRIRRDDQRHSLDELGAVAKATGARALEVAATDDATRRIPMGDEWSTVGVILAQLIHHGNEHRAQATTILGANGIEPPSVSAWGYGRATGMSEASE